MKLDLNKIGATTLKGIRRQLRLELKANLSGQKPYKKKKKARDTYFLTLVDAEKEVLGALDQLNAAISEACPFTEGNK